MTTEELLKLLVMLAGLALIIEILRWNAVQSLRSEMRYYYEELEASKWANHKKILQDPEFKKFYIQIMHPNWKFNFRKMTAKKVRDRDEN